MVVLVDAHSPGDAYLENRFSNLVSTIVYCGLKDQGFDVERISVPKFLKGSAITYKKKKLDEYDDIDFAVELHFRDNKEPAVFYDLSSEKAKFIANRMKGVLFSRGYAPIFMNRLTFAPMFKFPYIQLSFEEINSRLLQSNKGLQWIALIYRECIEEALK